MDWLVEGGEEYSLQTETLYLAVSYIDRSVLPCAPLALSCTLFTTTDRVLRYLTWAPDVTSGIIDIDPIHTY